MAIHVKQLQGATEIMQQVDFVKDNLNGKVKLQDDSLVASVPVKVPTPGLNSNDTRVATTAFVNGIIQQFSDTVAEGLSGALSAPLSDSADAIAFATVISDQLDAKQDKHAALTSISNLTTSANQMLYTTGANTYSTTPVTQLGREILAGASAAAIRSAIGALSSSDVVTGTETATKLASPVDIKISDDSGTNTGTAVSFDGSTGVTLKLPSEIKASLSGNATTATSATSDASGNNIEETYETKANAITDVSINGTTLTVTKGNGDTYSVITQDTDTKVTQAIKSDNNEYPLLAAATTNKTTTSTDTSVFSKDIKINPSTNTITATTFNGNATTATKAVQDGNGLTISSTYAKINSPALSGIPTAPTASTGTNTTQIATTAFVNEAIDTLADNLISGLSSSMDDPLSDTASTGANALATAISDQLDAKQDKSAALTSIAGLTTSADKMIYTTASNTYATTPISAFARTVLDDTSATTFRTTIDVYSKTEVQNQISALVNSAPETLDTLNELAAALGNDPNYATTITTALGNKQPLHAALTSIAGLTTAADKMIYTTAKDTYAVTTVSPKARELLDDADVATMRNTLVVPSKTGEGASGTWGINISGNAVGATNDKNGSDITTTYETKANAITDLSASGKVITYTKGNGTTGTIITQDTDTHYTTHLYAGASDGVTNATTTNGNTHLILTDDTTARNRIKILGSGGTTVTSDSSGNITIFSTTSTPNTDTLVTQNVSTTNNTYPILATPTANAVTSQGEKTAIFSSGVMLNPSTAALTASSFIGSLSGNASTASKLITAVDVKISDNSGANTSTAVSFDGSTGVTLKLPSTIKASLSGNATSATSATNDADGNDITETYATKTGAVHSITASGTTVTYKDANGTSLGTFTTQDTNNKMTQTSSTANASYAVLLKKDNTTTTATNDAYFNTGVYVNPSTKTITATTFSGNATSATKATQDGSGNVITSTYETKANAIIGMSASGTTVTYTKGDGTTESFVTQDTDTHYVTHLYAGANNGIANATTTNGNTHLILTDNTTARNRVKITGSGGTTVTSDSNGNITIFSSTSDPNTDTLMTQDVSTANDTYPILLVSTANATTNQGAKTAIFGSGVKVNPSTSTITATTFSGNLAGKANTAAKIDQAVDIKISDSSSTNTGTAVSFDGSAGVTLKLPATIKAALSGNATSATNATNDADGNDITTTYATKTQSVTGFSTNGTTVTYTKADGTTGTFTTQDTNTHYTTHLYAGTNNGTANAATTNGSTHLILTDDTAVRNRIKISGSGATTVTSDASGNITISSTDTNTNTDTLVTQDVSTANATYPILATPTADANANQGAKTSIFASGIKINPSTASVIATNFTGLASQATADASGNVITNTYATKAQAVTSFDVNGTTVTFTRADGTTGTFTTQDTNTDTNTHYTTHLYAGNNTSVANVQTSNGNTYLILADDSTARNRVKITGSGGTTVTSDSSGNITISSTATNLATDTLMTQAVSTTNNTYPLLATATANATDTATTTAVFASGVKLNPSTGTISATAFTGNLTGNVTGNVSGTAANVTGTVAVANGGTGITSNPSMLTNLGSTTAASVFATSPRPGVTGTLGVGNGGTGQTSLANVTGIGSALRVDRGALTGTAADNLMYVKMADNDFFRIRVGGTASNAGWVELATADDGNEPIYVRQYSGEFATVTRTATLLDASGNTSFPGTVTAPNFTGLASKATADASGNTITATYATKTEAVTGFSVNGTTVTYTKADGTTGTFTTQDTNTNTDTLVTQNVNSTNATYPILATPTADATANQGAKTAIFASGIKINPSTNTISATTFSGALSGNASTATKATQDASGNTITTTYATKTEAVTGFSVSGTTVTYTKADGTTGTFVTQDTNTDTLMTQNVSNANNTYPILLVAAANATTNQGAKTAIFASGVKVNPSTSTISATTFSGNLSGNANTATKATQDASGNTITTTYATKTEAVTGFSASGTTVTYTKADGTTGTFVTQDTNDHWTTHLYAGVSDGVANAATSNGATHLILTDNSTARNRIKISGSGATTVTSDANGNITISSTDTNTNTDTLMTQTVSTTNNTYPILATATANATATATTTAVFSKNIKINPSTGIISATGFSGPLSGKATSAGTADSATTATKATQDSAGNTITATYIKELTVNDSTITYKKGDDTTGTITVESGTVFQRDRTDQEFGEMFPILASVQDFSEAQDGKYTTIFATDILLDPSNNAISAPYFYGDLLGTADRAIADADNHNIITTYATKAAAVHSITSSGTTVTFKNAAGTSLGTFTTQDTNNKMTQTNSTANASYAILLKKNNTTTGETADAYFSTNVYVNPSTKTITATTFSGNATSATKATQDGDGQTISSTYAKLSGADFTGNVTGTTATLTGTLTLSKTTDLSGAANNSPALIVGGAPTSNHMEIDCNEIQAKATLSTVTKLYLNNDGGLVIVGTGGLQVNGDIDATGKTVTATTFSGKATSAGTADSATTASKAAQLTTARTIDGVDFDGTAAISHYGTCSTAAATAAKTVALAKFVLVTGALITVKFTVTNTAANPTLNVNSTGAKAIYYRGAAVPAAALQANSTYVLVYDGTNYDITGSLVWGS